MSTTLNIVSSSEIEDKLSAHKQLAWKTFTPERVSYLDKEISKAYVPGVGIQANVLCPILYGYNPNRKMYEGIAYHLFHLVATKDGSGHVYFIRISDVGTSAYPVISSIWHNLDSVVEEDSSEDSTVSDARSSLESSWSSESSDIVSKSRLSTVLSEMLSVCAKLSKVLTNSL